MSDPVIRIDGVTVRYGRKTAVDNVTFNVPRGSVYALLGRNGAGKSSLVRCLLGQQKPAAGAIEIFGEDVWRHRAALMERIGVVSEEADAPPEMSVAALSRFCARLHSRWDQAIADDRLQRFGIARTARFGDLSKGQKKEVALALATATSPELLILDDPTLGLDVVARKALFEEVIGELADRGITVLVTTHDLGGIETLADRVGILKNGALVVDDELEALKSRFRRIRYPATLSRAVVSNYDDAAVFEHAPGAEVAPMSLEEIFIAVTGEGAEK
jgi:ABC-2 type transport system ATP-binding protein